MMPLGSFLSVDSKGAIKSSILCCRGRKTMAQKNKEGTANPDLLSLSKWYPSWELKEGCAPEGSQVQFSSVQSLSCVRLCDPMDCSTSGLPVHHQPPEFIQTHSRMSHSKVGRLKVVWEGQDIWETTFLCGLE